MIATPTAVNVPFRMDEGNVIRIGDSRVTLQTIIADFERGASPEEIAHHFPALNLAQVYSVVAYYLQNKAEVDEYLQRQRQLAAEARSMYEADQANDPLRARLLARLEAQRNQVQR